MLKRTTRYQAAILDGHQILLLRVIDYESGATFWCIPGGGQEGAETEEDCVRREVREETSLEVAVERLLYEETGVDDRIYTGAKTFVCRVVGGIAQPGSEPEVDTPEQQAIQELGWFDLREPSGWPDLIHGDPITSALMERIRQALGYAPA
jgi:8-oxo-dGTP diphosphatase